MFFTWKYLIYLAIAVVAYYGYFKKHALVFLNTISLVLIAWWDYQSAIAVFGFSFLTYKIYQQNNKVISVLGIVFHIFALFYFKTNLLWAGSTENYITFLGLSYFSLQNISILLSSKNDQLSFSTILFGNVFFAKFVSGPILMKNDFVKLKPELNYRIENIAQGLQRILFGLAKKLILADRLAVMVNNIFTAENEYFNGFSLVFASVLFTFQMYLDFSAYCDIAIGTAKLFGIDLKENFKMPLRSITITEYWRKTHISLIDWLSQTIYYPIVYQFRKKPYLSVVVAIFCTFILSGFWHGLAIGYITWGAINGIYLIVEYTGRKKFKLQNKIAIIGIPITLILVSFSNFFFKAKTGENIKFFVDNFIERPFFPKDWMVEFVAIIGNGGHFLQQYNIIETFVLLLLFFGFEKQFEILSRNTKISYLYLISIVFCILFFGSFNAGDEFIYVQF